MRLHLPVLLVGVALGLGNGCGSVSGVDDGGGGNAGSGAAGSPGSGGAIGGHSGGAAGTGGGAGAGGGTIGSGGSPGGHGGGVAGAGGHGGGGTGTGGGAAGHAGNSGGGGKGGGGTGGTGGVSCGDLATQYTDAMPPAQSCDVNASGECEQLVSSSLSPCFLNCMTYVNDPTALNAIKASWEQAGCDSLVGINCPGVLCIQPTNKICLVGDGGGGVCSSNSGGGGGQGGHGGAAGSGGSAGAGGGTGGHAGSSGGGGKGGAGGGSECSPACDSSTLCCSEPSRTVTDAGVVVGSHWVCVAPTSAGACPLQP